MDSDHQQVRAGVDWSGFTLFLFSLCAVVLCAWIIWPFLPAITGAVILAVVTRRPYRWLAARFRNPSITAAIALLLVILSIITPATLVAYGVGQHVLDAVRVLKSGSPQLELQQFLAQHQRIAATLRTIADNIDPAQALESSAGAAALKAATILGHSIAAAVQIVIMLFVLFFLFRDTDEVMRLVRGLLPLGKDEAGYLLRRARTAINALVLGRFLVAAIQGLLAGFAFAILGVGGATLLGVATMLCALVPAVGAYIIWMPVVIYLAFAHFWIRAIILLAIGLLLISTLDNLLYPILVGSKLRLHTVPIFLAMLGGVWLFGITGLILGPIAFNVTASLLAIWRNRTYGERLIVD